MTDQPNLNALLGTIRACEDTLRMKAALLDRAAAERDAASTALADAQGAFDTAVASIRGAPKMIPVPTPHVPDKMAPPPVLRPADTRLPPAPGGNTENFNSADDKPDCVDPTQ